MTFVFIKGLLGFDSVEPLGFRISYFRDLDRIAAPHGIAFHDPSLPRRMNLAERAEHIAPYMETHDLEDVVLVGHSAGGLVARYVAANRDPRGRIATVITLCTPHRGSAVADWVLTDKGPFPRLVRTLDLPLLTELTTENCARFNAETPDRSDVRYLSWAAARPVREMPFWARPFARRLMDASGENDGQVSVSSARWGMFQEVLRADH